MGLTDSLLEAGLLERATIEIIDLTGRYKDEVKQDSVDASGGSAGGNTNVSKAVASPQALSAAAAAVAGNMGDVGMVQQIYNPNTDGIEGAVKRQFKVQFNPSTLSLSGFGGGEVQQMNFNSKDKNGGINYDKANPHIELSVQLIFDEMDLLEAFTADSLGSLVKGGLNKAGKAAGNALLKNTKVGSALGFGRPSVQEEVEGFLGAMRSVYTRNITFAWGKMMYSGVVNGVNAKYTMFNPSGKPVRATVNFRMVCADKNVAPGMMGYWEERYEALEKMGNKSFKSMSGGLLNLKK